MGVILQNMDRIRKRRAMREQILSGAVSEMKIMQMQQAMLMSYIEELEGQLKYLIMLTRMMIREPNYAVQVELMDEMEKDCDSMFMLPKRPNIRIHPQMMAMHKPMEARQ